MVTDVFYSFWEITDKGMFIFFQVCFFNLKYYPTFYKFILHIYVFTYPLLDIGIVGIFGIVVPMLPDPDPGSRGRRRRQKMPTTTRICMRSSDLWAPINAADISPHTTFRPVRRPRVA